VGSASSREWACRTLATIAVRLELWILAVKRFSWTEAIELHWGGTGQLRSRLGSALCILLANIKPALRTTLSSITQNAASGRPPGSLCADMSRHEFESVGSGSHWGESTNKALLAKGRRGFMVSLAPNRQGWISPLLGVAA
jgi:hypothetical protein